MKILKGSQGLTFFMAIFVTVVFLVFLSASVFLSRIGTKIMSNFKHASQALEVADAGLQHAVAVITVGGDFDSFLNTTVVGQTSFPNLPGFTYTVTLENDPGDSGGATDDTNNIAVLTSTANGPNETKRVVLAYVERSSVGFTPPGALYFPASSGTVAFDGTGLFITGDDTDYDGSPSPDPKPAISGVQTIYDAGGNDPVGDAFKNALGSNRYNLVQGSGYSEGPPVNPSINATDQVLDINQIALNFYNHPSAVKYDNGLVLHRTKCPSTNACTLGSDSSPQITYIKEGLNHIHFDGNVTGSGVLVVEGNAHIYGDFTFHGLVINIQPDTSGEGLGLPDDPEPFSLQGNAKIFGQVLIGPTNGPQRFYMAGSTGIYYSSKGVTMANNLCGSCLPKPARLAAWLDK